MNLPTQPIPAPGFKLVSGKRGPRRKEQSYHVQFRKNGYIDWKHTYTADQLRWTHDGSDWDVLAVREAD